MSVQVARTQFAGIGVALIWIVTYLVARLVLENTRLEPWLRVTVAMLPVLSSALFLWMIIAQVRSLDEMQRRIHLEALAFAFPLSVLLLWTLGLLQLAIDLPAHDWSYRHVWVFLPLFYFAGLGLAQWRYR